MSINEKLDKLKEILKEMGSVVLGFSGGVDSTFLLRVASDVLGDKVMAITASSAAFPQREMNEAIMFAGNNKIKHKVIVSEELDIDGFSQNPIDRCYHCKKELFTKISQTAKEEGFKYIIDGANVDDKGDYRPGMDAARELGVRSPLLEAGLNKADIRALSKDMDLPTWDKPSFACLSSRIPYGQEITREKLGMIDIAEQYLLDKGFRQVRVRHHGEIARIEVAPNEREKFFSLNLMDETASKFKEIGFNYVTLDIKGYRTGSMNEALNKE
ncbi:NH(3)-dependent NAD(+) synthetase [Oxobacter pfennigii]|uniref:NH(3)-dependent NAD(+) synthetase n=1 Tax=Oxobacter pfennigii TaxID=36849 RepID=A0A0P8WB99_9CLOT|nr:ATP-dependent sacrificial sulfur transferase LarE [Oxobacter pfennigii]KPU45899.1 NH(3)-dependent NAD(+) synthetase [Oxobacter pfennigii]